MSLTDNPSADNVRFERRSLKRRIGTATLTEVTSRRKSYEVAAWYKTVAVEPQTVPLYIYNDYVSWTFKGAVTDAYFPTLFGGVAVGNSSQNDTKEIGKPETVNSGGYHFWFAEAVGTSGTTHDGVKLTLDPGYASVITGQSTYDGTPLNRWDLTMPADGHPLAITRTASEPYSHHNDLYWEERERVTYSVTYQGNDKGTVTVDVRRNDQYNRPEDKAMRAAEALVFGTDDQ